MADPNLQRIKLRAKKLGVLIYDCRIAARRSVEDCAEFLGINTEEFKSFEKGSTSPSLPVLEALASFLDIPLSHFWENKILPAADSQNASQKEKTRRELRDRIIATRLRKERKNADISLRQIGKAVSLSPDLLKGYEMAETPIPLPELELLASALKIPFESFIDDIGGIGEWRRSKEQVAKFLALEPELREFTTNQDTKKLLDIAVALSKLPVETIQKIVDLASIPEDIQNQ